MLTRTEAYIQRLANVEFPAEELWIKNDSYFWAYAFSNGAIISTTGKYENGEFEKRSESLPYTRFYEILAQRENEGYHCFAIQIS